MPDALHDAARLVVAAWSSTRPAWIEQCNEAVLALDAALKAEPVQEPTQEPVASRLKMHSHDMRTELHSWEKAVLGPPHPGDFGIPKEHWEAAQHYANYWNENRAKAQPEPVQEPVAWAACENGALRAMGTDAASAELWRRGGYEIVPLVLGAQRPAVPGHVADTLARHGIDAPDALQGSLGVPIV